MLNDARREVTAIAEDLLAGRRDVLEACRRIAALRFQLPDALANDPDVMVFVAIDSELDDVPGADEAAAWREGAREQKKREADAYLAEVMPQILAAALSLRSKG